MIEWTFDHSFSQISISQVGKLYKTGCDAIWILSKHNKPVIPPTYRYRIMRLSMAYGYMVMVNQENTPNFLGKTPAAGFVE